MSDPLPNFRKVPYSELNARQRENHNFHKVAACLSDYGYHSIRLSDDFQGADFIALHIGGDDILRVQLKGRLTIDGKYEGKNLHVAFIEGDAVYVYPHDEAVAWVLANTKVVESASWRDNRGYSWPSVPGWIRGFLAPYQLA
ncbi:hypothetical protein [Falsirhodobacter xinxiangensis]|uniref:hypothetical protein n=1 Tax=Falsirhodobacter xinxiangensis TaxID=2530049 RepID=UPI0010AAB6FC|nr:hypothetical protein [Rhodobacter xinxiangensis]